METPSTLFTGIFGAFIVSCGTMVLIPNSQIGNLQPHAVWEEGKPSPDSVYPQKVSQLGRKLYAEHGCFYCHTQQIRDPQYGPDIERGWGTRRTVARDYIWEDVPYLGSTRLGPDLGNFGQKNAEGLRVWRNEPSADPNKPVARNALWIFQHLYNPRAIVSNSNCPPYPFLFTKKEIGEKPSPDAVARQGNYEIVPTLEAKHLAGYLLSLDRSGDVPEVKNATTQEAKK